MTKHKKISIAFAVILFILTATVNANTLYVATNGSNTVPYNTWAKAATSIQAAINAANNNDTIMVGSSGGHGAGTYTENIVVNKQLIILSENGYNATEVVAASADSHVFEVTTDNVTIDGFSIYGATGFNMAGIYLNSNNCTIKNNRCGWDVSHTNFRGICLVSSGTCTINNNTTSYNSGEGIYLDSSNEDTLKYNVASYNSGDGISLSISSNNTVNNNIANNNNFDGIRLVPSSNYNTLNNNTSLDNGNNGFLIVASNNNNLDGNTANNNLATHGFYLVSSSSNNTLNNNTANSNLGNGIRLETDCSGNVLTYNSVSHNEFGIFLTECSNNIINNNSMSENDGRIDGDGIMLTQSDYNTIADNIMDSDPGNGIEFYQSSNNNVIGNSVIGSGGWGIRINYYSSYNVFSNNTVTDRNIGIVLEEAHTIYNTIANNTTNNHSEDGIYLYNNTSNNILIGNNANNNANYGIHLDLSSDNTIYLNNLNNNITNNVLSANGSINTWNSPTQVYYDYNSGTFYKGYLGNYYSDGTHTGSNGIGGTYTIPNDNDDIYQITDSSYKYSLQTWWLNSDNNMYLDDASKPGGNDTINNGGTYIWKNAQVALKDINFLGTDSWIGQLVFISAPTNGHTFTIEIGYSDGNTFTTGGASAIVTGDGSSTSFTFTTNASAFTVSAGNYLALRITSNDAEYIVKTGGAWCYISSPEYIVNPGYNLTVTDSVCSGGSYTFPDGTTQNNITSQVIHTSNLQTVGTLYDSIIVTTVNVIEIVTSVSLSGASLIADAVDASYQWIDCDNGYIEIIGETNQSFTPTKNGNYAVVVFQNTCRDTSDCTLIVITGIDENEFSEKTKLYPNPTEGIVNVVFDKEYSDIHIVIKDVAGRILSTDNYLHTNTISINLLQNTGVYFIEISTETEKAVFKILKE